MWWHCHGRPRSHTTMVEGQRPKPGDGCGHRGTDRTGIMLGSWIPAGLVLLEWKEDAPQAAALSPVLHCPCVSPVPSHGIQTVSLCLAMMQGVKLFFLCKLGLINPFHQLQIYLLNPIKNMNMQIQTFFNTHFQGLGVRLDYSIPVNSL